MVSASEGLIYYCTVFLTALVFLIEASAITTNYEKSTSPNKTHDEHAVSSHRTKSTPSRSRASLSSKKQNHDRVSPILPTKLKSSKIEHVSRAKLHIDEILSSSNSGGENEAKDKGAGSSVDDEDQKTLSQQVAEGKYGLIQHEIFTTKPKKLGVISYDVNPEVPRDNVNNLGGLEPDDIWLAENHLLVLAGAGLHAMQNQWTPIDDYVAPQRPVKIPPNPKVPPPFPVQLSENGPIEYIGSALQPAQPYAIFNPLYGQYPNFNSSRGYPQSLYEKVNPPSMKHSKYEPPSSVIVKPLPGAEFIPPYLGVTNQSDTFDEDDPSLYYPPPYDFHYPTDNTSKVPAGPLVPGIVMPPPPNFFSSFENDTTRGNAQQMFPSAAKDQPYKTNPYKFGKQLNYVDKVNGGLRLTPTSATDAALSEYVTYNELVNHIPHSSGKGHKANPPVDSDWIPIPAPNPLYITGPKKPIKNTLLVMMETPTKSSGYSYNQPENTLRIPKKKPAIKLLQHTDKLNNFPSTTPFISQLFTTQIPSIRDEIPSTTPLVPSDQSAAIKATYYFYEEPKFVDSDQSKSIYTSTISPPAVVDSITKYYESDVSTPSKFDDHKREPNPPLLPIYYLAELDNIVDLIKPMDLPQPLPSPANEYHTSTVKPNIAFATSNNKQSTSNPIYEHNYVASHYNNPASHSAPNSLREPGFNAAPPVPHYLDFKYDDFYRPSPSPQPQRQPPAGFPSAFHGHYSVFNPIVDYNQLPIHTTPSPILFFNPISQYAPTKVPQYHLDRPWMQNLNPYGHVAFPTENPYYAFFTKEDADLIDENTKKYFTIFGQKIKHTVESTSPVSAVHTTGNNRWRYPKYPSQSSTSSHLLYRTTTATPTTPPSTSQSASEENSDSQSHPLEDDTRVNYGTPVPPLNPNAEYLSSKLSKHIRPIVVQDLPTDLNERLKNLINSGQSRNNLVGNLPNGSTPHFRYTLVDSLAYDSRPHRYSQYYPNTYKNSHREPQTAAYGGQESSSAISLRDDTRVNEYRRNQKQSRNPDAEYIRDSNDGSDERDEAEQLSASKPISLQNDVLVNYKKPPPPDPDAEYIDTQHRIHSSSPPSHAGADNHNIVSYSYPNVERGHFYFLTPHETRLSHIEDERHDFQSNVEKPSSYFKRDQAAAERPKAA